MSDIFQKQVTIEFLNKEIEATLEYEEAAYFNDQVEIDLINIEVFWKDCGTNISEEDLNNIFLRQEIVDYLAAESLYGPKWYNESQNKFPKKLIMKSLMSIIEESAKEVEGIIK